MNGVLGAAAIVTALVGVIALLYTTRDRVRARAQQQVAETAALASTKFTQGAASRDDEVRQLTFERDDARRDLADLRVELRDIRLENHRLRGDR